MKLNPDAIKIIVVDDNVSNVSILKEVLERPGVEVITSTQPEDVMNLCIAEEFSIALIDIQMPKISGFELLIQLKSNPRTENLVVILMTGHSMSNEEVFLGLSSGAVDYLFKPLDLNITLAKINSFLTLIQYQREIQRKNKELECFQEDLYHAIEEAKKSKEIKENFLANMSHEIRTPLNGIIGITNLLQHPQPEAIHKKMIKLLDFSSHTLLGIVNDILENFQIDAGKIKLEPEVTDINALIQTIVETLQPLAAEKNLLLNYETEGDIPSSVLADPLRIKQVLINLINNAIKFTPAGSVTVILKGIATYSSHADLQFIVRDTGLGIPQSSLAQIFERFEQVQDKSWQKFGGTGLGLSIVKRLVELMEGKLEIKSIIGSGTTFFFNCSFKCNEGEAVTSGYSIIKPPTMFAGFSDVSLLLVEDNPINQFVAVKMLQSWNVKVDTAINGFEALEKLDKNNYDLILMDTHMPEMNGIEATRKIRSQLNDAKCNIPIISFSASVIEKEKQEALSAGVNDFLEKPFQPEILYKKILTILTKNTAAAS